MEEVKTTQNNKQVSKPQTSTQTTKVGICRTQIFLSRPKRYDTRYKYETTKTQQDSVNNSEENTTSI